MPVLNFTFCFEVVLGYFNVRIYTCILLPGLPGPGLGPVYGICFSCICLCVIYMHVYDCYVVYLYVYLDIPSTQSTCGRFTKHATGHTLSDNFGISASSDRQQLQHHPSHRAYSLSDNPRNSLTARQSMQAVGS